MEINYDKKIIFLIIDVQVYHFETVYKKISWIISTIKIIITMNNKILIAE